jgi:hypothetical protein
VRRDRFFDRDLVAIRKQQVGRGHRPLMVEEGA